MKRAQTLKRDGNNTVNFNLLQQPMAWNAGKTVSLSNLGKHGNEVHVFPLASTFLLPTDLKLVRELIKDYQTQTKLFEKKKRQQTDGDDETFSLTLPFFVKRCRVDYLCSILSIASCNQIRSTEFAQHVFENNLPLSQEGHAWVPPDADVVFAVVSELRQRLTDQTRLQHLLWIGTYVSVPLYKGRIFARRWIASLDHLLVQSSVDEYANVFYLDCYMNPTLDMRQKEFLFVYLCRFWLVRKRLHDVSQFQEACDPSKVTDIIDCSDAKEHVKTIDSYGNRKDIKGWVYLNMASELFHSIEAFTGWIRRTHEVVKQPDNGSWTKRLKVGEKHNLAAEFTLPVGDPDDVENRDRVSLDIPTGNMVHHDSILYLFLRWRYKLKRGISLLSSTTKDLFYTDLYLQGSSFIRAVLLIIMKMLVGVVDEHYSVHETDHYFEICAK